MKKKIRKEYREWYLRVVTGNIKKEITDFGFSAFAAGYLCADRRNNKKKGKK